MYEESRSRMLLCLVAVLAIAVSLTLLGCGDDDDDFAPAEVNDLANRQFTFSDGGAFGINQSVTLTIENFDETGLLPVAPFTLSTNPTASGMVTVVTIADEDIADCDFAVANSDFPAGEGPQDGETIDARCLISDGDGLQVSNQDTNETSTGERVVTGTGGS